MPRNTRTTATPVEPPPAPVVRRKAAGGHPPIFGVYKYCPFARFLGGLGVNVTEAERFFAGLEPPITPAKNSIPSTLRDPRIKPAEVAPEHLALTEAMLAKIRADMGVELGAREAALAEDLGKAPDRTSPEYEPWLRAQPHAVQDEVLGKAAAKAFRKGASLVSTVPPADPEPAPDEAPVVKQMKGRAKRAPEAVEEPPADLSPAEVEGVAAAAEAAFADAPLSPAEVEAVAAAPITDDAELHEAVAEVVKPEPKRRGRKPAAVATPEPEAQAAPAEEEPRVVVPEVVQATEEQPAGEVKVIRRRKPALVATEA